MPQRVPQLGAALAQKIFLQNFPAHDTQRMVNSSGNQST
jgi:hypothetical protein